MTAPKGRPESEGPAKPAVPEEKAEKAGSDTKGRSRQGRKTKRRVARELALQGLYQWNLAGGSAGGIEAQLRESDQFARADAAYLGELLKGILAEAQELEEIIRPELDREFKELSPVEISILLMGTHELKSRSEMPYRVVINEAVELAKAYGGTHGHKYVNGVLDKVAAKLRPSETSPKV